MCLSDIFPSPHRAPRKVQSGDGMGLNMAIDEDNIYSGVELELPPYINYDPGNPNAAPRSIGEFLSWLVVRVSIISLSSFLLLVYSLHYIISTLRPRVTGNYTKFENVVCKGPGGER